MKIKETVVKAGYKALTFGKKHLSEELAIAGGIFVVGGMIFSYKAARKKDEVLEKINDDILALHELKNESDTNELTEEDEYYISDREYKKTLTILYMKKAGKVCLLFAPAVGCGVAGIACFLGAEHVLKVKNAALTSAFGALSTRFDEYRENVRDEIGEDREFDIYHGIKHEKETVVSEKEDGTKKHEKVDSKVIRKDTLSTKIFKFGNKGFVADMDLNEFQIRAYMQWAKQKCGVKGHIQLSEINETFGWDDTADDIVFGYTNPDDIDWKLERVRIPISDPISGKESFTDAILVDFGNVVNVCDRI